MKKLFFLLLIPMTAVADRLGDLRSGANVALASQTVNNTSALQSGATFYVSSGTVSGPLAVNSLSITGLSSGQCAQIGVGGNVGGTGSPCLPGTALLVATQTWSGQNNWATPAQSTFTYGLSVGSLTITSLSNTALAVNANGVVISTAVSGVGSGLLVGTQTWSGQNQWVTPAQSSFTYGLSAGSLTLTGTGNFVFVNPPDGVSYQVLGSTGNVTSGLLLVYAASNTAIPSTIRSALIAVDANGVVISSTVSGSGTPGGATGQIQWNNGGNFSGSTNTVVTVSSITFLSSTSFSLGGIQNSIVGPGYVDVFNNTSYVGKTLFSVGSAGGGLGFYVPDRVEVFMGNYGAQIGNMDIGDSHGASQQRINSRSRANFIDLQTASTMTFNTDNDISGGDMIFQPQNTELLRISKLTGISMPGVLGSSITFGLSVGSITVASRNYMSGGVVYSSSFSAVNASSATGVTSYVKSNLSAQITPKFTTSRVKISVSGQIAASGALSAECDVSISTTGTIITSLATNPLAAETDIVAGQTGVGNGSFHWVDSPNTTSAITYTVIMKGAGTTPTCTFNSGSSAGTASIFVEDIGAQ